MARTSVSLLPLDSEPISPGPYPTSDERAAQLLDSLRGVELGAYDERIAAWAVRTLDVGTLNTLLSWIERARVAAVAEVK